MGLGFRNIFTIQGGFQPVLGFVLFTIGIGELADEMFLVTSFCPSLRNLCPN